MCLGHLLLGHMNPVAIRGRSTQATHPLWKENIYDQLHSIMQFIPLGFSSIALYVRNIHTNLLKSFPQLVMKTA